MCVSHHTWVNVLLMGSELICAGALLLLHILPNKCTHCWTSSSSSWRLIHQRVFSSVICRQTEGADEDLGPYLYLVSKVCFFKTYFFPFLLSDTHIHTQGNGRRYHQWHSGWPWRGCRLLCTHAPMQSGSRCRSFIFAGFPVKSLKAFFSSAPLDGLSTSKPGTLSCDWFVLGVFWLSDHYPCRKDKGTYWYVCAPSTKRPMCFFAVEGRVEHLNRPSL